jgi:hypothetical protein
LKVEGAKAQISKGLCERRKPAQGGFNEKQRVFTGETREGDAGDILHALVAGAARTE